MNDEQMETNYFRGGLLYFGGDSLHETKWLKFSDELSR